MTTRMLSCTVSLHNWLRELAFLGHALSLGLDRLRRDATDIRANLPDNSQRDGIVLRKLKDGLEHAEAIKRGFSPNQLIDGNAKEQGQSLNRLLLFETLAAYERWATEMQDLLAVPESFKKTLRKDFDCKNVAIAMQFPNAAMKLVSFLAQNAPYGQPPGLKAIGKRFRTDIIKEKKINQNSFSVRFQFKFLLRDHLLVYRAHKELRNCLVHSNVRVDRKFEDARSAYDRINPTSIGIKELPQLIPIKEGDPATATLRGVFGLMYLVERIAIIIDGYAN